MSTPRKNGYAWYALRRTLPPWDTARNIEELLAFCKAAGVDEVIAKVDTEEFTHGLPTAEWLEGYLPVLRALKARLTEAGVVFSLNPWVTLVHVDRGQPTKTVHPDVDLMVGHDGTECRVCACPLSSGWRRLTRELWTRYAELAPAVLWVEDDIRLHNHPPARFGCFCPLHLEAFRTRIGASVSREALVEALLQPGVPHPYRAAWLDLNRDIMIEVAGFLERTVHETAPETCLGLMSSDPNRHALEGRDWPAFVAALAGPRPLVSRPPMFCYTEGSPRELYEAEHYVRATLHCLGGRSGTAIVQTEIDNDPFGPFNKSNRFSFLQLAISFLLGADGVTLNLFDHLGNSLDRVPNALDLLRRNKPFLSGLAERCHGGRPAGIRLMHASRGSYHVRLRDGADYVDLAAEGQSWRRLLEPLGFPVVMDDSPVTALSGQVVRALPDDEIRGILAQGALLDLGALRALIDMGHGSSLGVSIEREFRRRQSPMAAEEYVHPGFGGGDRQYLTMKLMDPLGEFRMAALRTAPGAIVVSRAVDGDAKPLYPLLTLYENSLGGRIAVYPIEMEPFPGVSLLGELRRRQFHAVLHWLYRGRTPLCVEGGAYPLPIRLDSESRTVVGTLNLCLDDWPHASFDLLAPEGMPRQVERLGEDGTWQVDPRVTCRQTGDRLRVTVAGPIPALSVLALSLGWG